ncbi:IS1182 family transposase [Reyranella sp. CPCC 100927]|uniref:IS1182 family transposase n=1 Tax=Reyranella sp. CPCC 100927 TaxID=2599616 RepID=UPI0011B3AF43|nr:IS1182 family transposase [Reyranella sp. CPCC 100927]TWT15560.1 IS1182 family transposase [Reyranella sp. CPCC 100927]
MAQGRKAGLRLAMAERSQIEWQMACLDELLPQDHRARQVWMYVEGLDLSGLYEAVGSVSGEAGRPAIDPAILVALWLYATLEDVGSARQVARLCERDIAYRWVLGGVGVSHKTLSDFRVDAGAVLDDLLSRSVAALVAADVMDLQCVAVDGVRLRASAGASSFRSKQRLGQLHDLACQKVAALRAELDSDPAASDRRGQRRRLQAAADRQRRIEQAQQAQAEIEAQRAAEAKQQRRKKPANKREPRASTSDPQARVMKMADGGFRPGFNAQFKTAVGNALIVGVSVDNNGSDRGRLGATVVEIEQRYGLRPQQVLADSGYDSKADIAALHEPGNGAIEVFCPLPRDRRGQVRSPCAKDGTGVLAWHQRMNSDDGRALYRQRFATERPHADMRNRGLTRVLVRGIKKVTAVVLWHVHAYNFLTISRLLRTA